MSVNKMREAFVFALTIPFALSAQDADVILRSPHLDGQPDATLRAAACGARRAADRVPMDAGTVVADIR